MKKITTFCITVFLVFSCLMNIEAKKNESTLSITEQNWLEEIMLIDPNYKLDDGDVVSVSKVTRMIESESSNTLDSFDDSISPMGAIGSTYMTIYITAKRVADPTYDTFKIEAIATWLAAPIFRLEDAFAVSWGQGFALISEECIASYVGVGIVSGKTSKISVSANAGVGYSVQASLYYGQRLDYTKITAVIKQNNSSGMANATASYAHATMSIGGLAISFGSDGKTIGFSVGLGTFDTMANYTYFYY